MSDIYLILSALGLGFAITIFFLRRWTRPDDSVSQWLRSSTHDLNQRLDNSASLIAAVQKNLGEMSEIGRGIKNLQEFLQSPKIRGGLGEEVLEEMIKQTFPKSIYRFQYSFKTGSRVDAIIKTGAGLLCIDSKFPMGNFRALINSQPGSKQAFVSDIKKHISDISQKYILPAENTLDFALMFVPSESVYYEVVNIQEISDFARKHRVYPVSPNTLYAHLQVLLLAFQGQELETKTREVWELLRAIQKDYSQADAGLQILSKHLTNASNQMTSVSQVFDHLGQHLAKTQHLSSKDRPEIES